MSLYIQVPIQQIADGLTAIGWSSAGGGGDATLSYGSTVPATPVNGTLWYDTTATLLKLYTGGTWTTINVSAETIATISGYATTAQDSANTATQKLTEFKAIQVTATTLEAGASATASFNSGTGVITLGIPTGATGQGLSPKGTDTVANILLKAGTLGDYWIASDTGNGYMYDGLSWVNVGAVKGDKGDKGDTGLQGIQGATGTQGIQGIQGVKGDTGVGVPTGGTTGQVLSKVDATNYNTTWIDVAGGGGFTYMEASNPLITTNGAVGDLWFNTTTMELFICRDATTNLNKWEGDSGTMVINYTLDILGDGSCTSAFLLDGNISGISAVGTITNYGSTFTVGKFGQCLMSASNSSGFKINKNMRSISFFAYFPTSVTGSGYFFDCRAGYASYCYMNSDVSPGGISGCSIYINGVSKGTNVVFPTLQWVNVVIVFDANIDYIVLLNHEVYSSSNGISNVKVDNIRCFNRVLTAPDMTILASEV